MNKIVLKIAASVAISLSLSLAACDSYKEPQTDAEWKAFCEAPDSMARLKAITNETKRQNAASMCFRAPWQKFEPSKPRIW